MNRCRYTRPHWARAQPSKGKGQNSGKATRSRKPKKKKSGDEEEVEGGGEEEEEMIEEEEEDEQPRGANYDDYGKPYLDENGEVKRCFSLVFLC